MSRLTEDAFCGSVAESLRSKRPDLRVSVVVDGGHFVVQMDLPGRPTNVWRRPVNAPAYDAALGEPWSQDQAYYLALLAEEENTVYLAYSQRRVEGLGIPHRVPRRRWWRRD